MAGPWEDYQQPDAPKKKGPWDDFQADQRATAIAQQSGGYPQAPINRFAIPRPSEQFSKDYPRTSGVIQGAEGIAESALSPVGGAALVGSMAAPYIGIPARALALAGGAAMVKPTANAIVEGIQAKDPLNRAKAFTEAAGSGAMAFTGLHEGILPAGDRFPASAIEGFEKPPKPVETGAADYLIPGRPYYRSKQIGQTLAERQAEVNAKYAGLQRERAQVQQEKIQPVSELQAAQKTAKVGKAAIDADLANAKLQAGTGGKAKLAQIETDFAQNKAKWDAQLSDAMVKNAPYLKSQVIKVRKAMTDWYGGAIEDAMEGKELFAPEWREQVPGSILQQMDEAHVPKDTRIYQTIKGLSEAPKAEAAEGEAAQKALKLDASDFDNAAINQFASQKAKDSLGHEPNITSTGGKTYRGQTGSAVKGNINKIILDARQQAGDALDLTYNERVLLESDTKAGEEFRAKMAPKLQALTDFPTDTPKSTSSDMINAKDFKYQNKKVMDTVRQSVKDGSVSPNQEEYWAYRFKNAQGQYAERYVPELKDINSQYREMSTATKQLVRATKPYSPDEIDGSIALMKKLVSGEDIGVQTQAALKASYGGPKNLDVANAARKVEEGTAGIPGLGKGALTERIKGPAQQLAQGQEQYQAAKAGAQKDIATQQMSMAERQRVAQSMKADITKNLAIQEEKLTKQIQGYNVRMKELQAANATEKLARADIDQLRIAQRKLQKIQALQIAIGVGGYELSQGRGSVVGLARRMMP